MANGVIPRRFPAPWSAEQIPGGYKVVGAIGQALAYRVLSGCLAGSTRLNHCPPLSRPLVSAEIPGGYKVVDATGQALAYVYCAIRRRKRIKRSAMPRR